MNDIKITQKPIADLIPYSRNPRRNDEAVPMVMNSIKEFGFKVPIVIDKNNIIVCGHTRFKAALKLGLETVPCIVADDLSDEQIKAFRLADNKVSEKAEWDFEILSDELDDIINIDFVKYNDASSAKTPMETMTKGRVYVTVNDDDELVAITYYDNTGKRTKQIDLNHMHNKMQPHTHHGYFHNENDGKKGATRLTKEEKKMVESVEKVWHAYLSRR